MGQFTMAFHGICMHLNGGSVGLPLGVRHRVVGIDASHGYESSRFGHLPPHRVFLDATPDVATRLAKAGLARDREGYFPLTSTRITVENPSGRLLAPSLDLVPSLREYAPGMVVRPELAGFTEPQTGDSFIDMTHGLVQGHRFFEGGIYTAWTVETVGDPQISIVRTGQKAILVPLPSTPLETASFTFKNGTTDRSDKKFDFALHYLAAVGSIDAQQFTKQFPIDPDFSTRGGVDTSTSCSNSQFP